MYTIAMVLIFILVNRENIGEVKKFIQEGAGGE
jgi:hypothetical protein